jgi:hypothetical protein
VTPQDFKTHKHYLAYIQSCEKALYQEYEFKNFFDEDPLVSRGRNHATRWYDNGLRVVTYRGHILRAHGTSIFDIKDDRCTVEGYDYCIRCYSGVFDDEWDVSDDEIIPVNYYLGFDSLGDRVVREIHFDQDFAASEAHP